MQVALHIPPKCREAPRFGGGLGAGSDRNRAFLVKEDNSMHGMQIAQSLINTGDCASR